MLCAKHGDDISKLPDKEQFGQIWLCRYAIWDSQTVTDLLLKQDVQDAYNKRKANPPAKIQSLRDFMATNPSDQAVIDYMEKFKQ